MSVFILVDTKYIYIYIFRQQRVIEINSGYDGSRKN